MWGERENLSLFSMLRGPTKVTLDAKGRLSMPTKYRERIISRCDGKMICTVDHRRCLLIYPLPDWEEAERKLMRLPSLNHTAQKLKGLLLGYATDVEMDGHGRRWADEVEEEGTDLPEILEQLSY
jgi:MraZ protein